jgi:DNA repair protein RecO (recombination protein O)
LNELLVRLLPREDPHPELFDAYLEAVGAFCHEMAIEPTLRRFERPLLEKIGYGADLARASNGSPIYPTALYGFDPVRGWVIQTGVADPDDRRAGMQGFAGATLRALASGAFDDPQLLAQMKSLTRMMLNARLEGRPLATRQILLDLQRL